MQNLTIENAQYTVGSNGDNSNIQATIDGTKMFVPLDPANRHYAAILEWAKKDGNEIQAAD